MKTLISMIAAAALAVSFSLPAKAQSNSGVTKPTTAPTSQIKKASYGKKMRHNCGSSSKMSGAC